MSYQDPDAKVVPSGENDTEKTVAVCPSSMMIAFAVPVPTSHSRTVLSDAPVASVVPSGENDTEKTVAVCPSSVAIASPVAVFHSRTVPSSDPVASSNPSGENDTEIAPKISMIALPVVRFHSTNPCESPMLLLTPAYASSNPSGENATESPFR